MTQNWPVRYRCKKCTRSTSSYPFGCPEEDCPIKRDVVNDIKFDFFVGMPLFILFILVCFFSVPLFFSLIAQR